MSTRYAIDEIFQFALQIEKNGRELYEKLEKKFKDYPDLAKLFGYLAEQEVSHAQYFETLLGEITAYEPVEQYPEEYFEYLKAFGDNAVFSRKTVQEALSEIKDPRSALQFSIQRELDSINYYSGLQHLATPEDKRKIEGIIREEKRHFLDLYKLFHRF